MTRVLYSLMLLLTSVTCALPVDAGCQLTSGNHNVYFGNTSTLSIAQTRQTTQVSDAGLWCSGAFLSILGFGNQIEARASSLHQGRLVKDGGQDALPYTVYADPHHDREIDWQKPFNYFDANLLDLLGLLGGNAHAIPMFMRTQSGNVNLSPGHYTDQITVQWRWNICDGIGLLGICIGRDRGSSTSIINLQLDIAPDCVITAPNIEFGAAPLVGGFNPVTQTLSVRCSKGTAYSVGLSDGLNANGAQRRMRAGTAFLAYELYKGVNGEERWGRYGSERRSSNSAELMPAQLDGLTAQGFVFHAEVLRAQDTPPPGRYQDSVVVDVAF